MKKTTFKAVFVMAILLLGFLQVGKAQINISSGNTASENFDGIGVTATATLPTGWKADKNTTVRLVGTYSAAVLATEQTAGNSMSATASNGIYNYAAGVPASATDRAVGGISSGSASKSVNVYVNLFNNGVTTINQLTISYNVEKYRHGSNAAGFSIQMYYSADGTTWTSAGASFLTSFAADADNLGYVSAPGATTAVTAQALVQSIAASGNFYLAWNYSVTTGSTTSNAQGLGIDDISITADASASIVESPFFTPAAGNYFTPQSVTIASNTPGTDIYYTTDGTDPSNSPVNGTLYSSPVPVSVTTTIKAKAYKTGMTASGISSALYRFPIDVANIAALRAGTVGGVVYKLTSEAIVTYQRPDAQRNQMYIQDATGAIVVDDLDLIIALNDYNIGDGVTGITGTLYNFNSLLEFVPLQDPGAASSTGHVITPLAKTLATLTTADQAKLVSIPLVSFTPATGTFAVSTNYPITDPSGAGVLRTVFGEADYLAAALPTTPQNIIALVGQVAAQINITPRYLSDFTPFTPSWTSGWPKAENPSPATFNAKVNIDVPGTAYFVVLPNAAAAPTALQVKNGQDATGTAVAVNLAGTIACAAGNTEYIVSVTGLAASTTYNVYFVAEAYGNLQVAPVMKSVTTTTGGTAPVIISPTATGMTNNSAILGGNITFNGGSAITERGTVWKTSPGVAITDNKLAEGGTTVGVFTHTRNSLPAATHIYYAAYATNTFGTTLTSESSFYSLTAEPTNHATAFAAGTTTTTSILLAWTDATGAILPTAYLIKGSSVSLAAITDPVDGTPEADAALVQNVNQGVGTFTFTNLSAGIPYYFKIYPYTGANATINFKTSPTAPTATANTLSAAYTWIGADNGLWTLSTNWNPPRTSPALVDVLQFNDGITKTITGVPATETIGQLVLSNNTTVNLQSSVPAVLTIGGLPTGHDLVVPVGSALNLTALVNTNTIVIKLAAVATGEINGNMAFTGPATGTLTSAHRLLTSVANVIAINFNIGSIFTAGLNFAGNAFGGTTAPLGFASSISFNNGSTYIHQSGSNPFGTSPGVAIFQTGSLYKVTGAVTPSFSGRTYANLEYDLVGGTFTQTGASAVVMDNLSVTNGILNFNVTAAPGHLIKGNIVVGAGGTLNFSPTAAGTVNLNGTVAQTISGSGTITNNSFSTLVVNNNAGVTLDANATLNGTLTLSSGLLTLGTGNLTFGATGVLSGTPSATNMIVATNTGELRKTFTADGSYTFPVGDNTGTAEYSPVTLAFAGGTYTSAYAGVNLKDASVIGTTGSNLSRYWNLSSNITGFTCNAQFNYLLDDVIGTEGDIYCVLVTPPTNYAVANTTLHQLTATGVTTFGTFTGKEPVVTSKTLNLTSVLLQGLYAGGGILNQATDGTAPQWPAGVADHITVELHTAASYATLAAPAYTGVELSTTGTATITVDASLSGNYWITVKHPSHIETVSATAVSFAGSVITQSFGAPADVYAGNLLLMGDLGYTIFGGDVTQDGIVDGGDMSIIENLANLASGGYLPEDCNGDGVIDGGDMNIIENNANLAAGAVVPTP